MQRLRTYAILLMFGLLLAACQPVGSQATTSAAGASDTAATTMATEEAATEATAEATTGATTEAAAAATMDHSTMDHSAMGHGDEPFDAQFIDGMIVHHEGAIAMAEQVLAESERPELRQMAEAIIAAQQGEVEQMHTWRGEWYPDHPETMGMDMDMGQMEIADDDAKPFDQRFLEAMIDHHEGAIDMARAALESSEHHEVHMMAEAIISTQQAEIDQMRAWLNEWFGVQ